MVDTEGNVCTHFIPVIPRNHVTVLRSNSEYHKEESRSAPAYNTDIRITLILSQKMFPSMSITSAVSCFIMQQILLNTFQGSFKFQKLEFFGLLGYFVSLIIDHITQYTLQRKMKKGYLKAVCKFDVHDQNVHKSIDDIKETVVQLTVLVSSIDTSVERISGYYIVICARLYFLCCGCVTMIAGRTMDATMGMFQRTISSMYSIFCWQVTRKAKESESVYSLGYATVTVIG